MRVDPLAGAPAFDACPQQSLISRRHWGVGSGSGGGVGVGRESAKSLSVDFAAKKRIRRWLLVWEELGSRSSL